MAARNGDLRQACLPCSEKKRACSRLRDAAPDEPCNRCRSTNTLCIPQDMTLSRRQRERQRRGDTDSCADTDSVYGDENEDGSRKRALRSVKRANGKKEQSDLSLDKSLEAIHSGGHSGITPPKAVLGIPLNPTSAYMPLPPEVQLPEPLVPGQTEGGLMFLALAAYWSFVHVSQPCIHRETFESAFNDGPRPPLALLYAMAVNGLRFVQLPGLTDETCLALSRSWCSKARDMLVFRYYTNERTISHLEAAQTLMLLYTRLVSELVEPSPFSYVERAAEIMPRLIEEPDTNDLVGLRPPASHSEWIRVEQILRLFIIFVATDYGYAYLTDRKPLLEHFHRLAIPVHDSFFDLASSVEAFKALGLLYPAGNIWMQADLSLIPQSIELDSDFACIQIRNILEPVWTRRSSSLALTYCLSFLRHMRGRMRGFASQTGVDPITLASQPPQLDSLVEGLYRRHVEVFHAMVLEMIVSMPPEIAETMISGNPSGLFRNAVRYFDDPGYAHVVVCVYISAQGMEIENWMPDVPSQPGIEFFSSKPFVEILESGILAARMMEGQLAEDPYLRWHRSWAFIPGARVGGLHIAAVNKMSSAGVGWTAIDEARKDAAIAGRWLDVMGRYYKPLGHQMAQNFSKMILDAGCTVDKDAESEDAEQHSPLALPVTEMSAAFTETVLAVEIWVRKWKEM